MGSCSSSSSARVEEGEIDAQDESPRRISDVRRFSLASDHYQESAERYKKVGFTPNEFSPADGTSSSRVAQHHGRDYVLVSSGVLILDKRFYEDSKMQSSLPCVTVQHNLRVTSMNMVAAKLFLGEDYTRKHSQDEFFVWDDSSDFSINQWIPNFRFLCVPTEKGNDSESARREKALEYHFSLLVVLCHGFGPVLCSLRLIVVEQSYTLYLSSPIIIHKFQRDSSLQEVDMTAKLHMMILPTIFDDISDGIFALYSSNGSDWKIAFANRSFLDLTSIPLSAVLNMPISHFSRLILQSVDLEDFAKQCKFKSTRRFELMYIRKNAEAKRLLLEFSTIGTGSEHLQVLYVFVRDMTDAFLSERRLHSLSELGSSSATTVNPYTFARKCVTSIMETCECLHVEILTEENFLSESTGTVLREDADTIFEESTQHFVVNSSEQVQCSAHSRQGSTGSVYLMENQTSDGVFVGGSFRRSTARSPSPLHRPQRDPGSEKIIPLQSYGSLNAHQTNKLFPHEESSNSNSDAPLTSSISLRLPTSLPNGENRRSSPGESHVLRRVLKSGSMGNSGIFRVESLVLDAEYDESVDLESDDPEIFRGSLPGHVLEKFVEDKSPTIPVVVHQPGLTHANRSNIPSNPAEAASLNRPSRSHDLTTKASSGEMIIDDVIGTQTLRSSLSPAHDSLLHQIDSSPMASECRSATSGRSFSTCSSLLLRLSTFCSSCNSATSTPLSKNFLALLRHIVERDQLARPFLIHESTPLLKYLPSSCTGFGSVYAFLVPLRNIQGQSFGFLFAVRKASHIHLFEPSFGRETQNFILSVSSLFSHTILRTIESVLLVREKQQTEKILGNLFPIPIAKKLKEVQAFSKKSRTNSFDFENLDTGAVDADIFAKYDSEATILFLDLVSFTSQVSKMSPPEFLEFINKVFGTADLLLDRYSSLSVEKIKTIGDALLVVGGLSWDKKGNTHKRSASFAELASTEIARVHSARLGNGDIEDMLIENDTPRSCLSRNICNMDDEPSTQEHHDLPPGFDRLAPSVQSTFHVLRFALDLRREMESLIVPGTSEHISVRIGIHRGSVFSGVVGRHRMQFDIFGDAVNIASRMESLGQPGKIQCSQQVADTMLDFFQFEERGWIEPKGKEKMKAYFLLSEKRHELHTSSSLLVPHSNVIVSGVSQPFLTV